MKAIVSVEFKPGVLDPEAAAIGKSLSALGFDGISAVRRVRQIEMEIAGTNEAQARASVQQMCDQLLANPVIETYRIDIHPG